MVAAFVIEAAYRAATHRTIRLPRREAEHGKTAAGGDR
jgi:hypothetical protein